MVSQQARIENNVTKMIHRILDRTKPGNLRSIAEETKMIEDKFTVTDTNSLTYFHADEIRLQKIAVDRKVSGDVDAKGIFCGVVNTTEDSNGNISTVQGDLSDKESFRSLIINPEKCIVVKKSNKGENHYFYAEKRPGKIVLIAYFGDIDDESLKKSFEEYKPTVINMDVNHQPISAQYPPQAPSRYCVPRDMDYYEIAEELNYAGYEEQLAAANNATVSEKVKANTTIEIPPLYFEVPETAWSGSIPSAEKIIGSLYPNLPSPTIFAKPQTKRHHMNWLATVLEVAASVAIMTFAPEAITAICGQFLAGLGVAGATATTTTALTTAINAVGYGVTGALANGASQVVGMGLDHQKFDLKALGSNALSTAISAGMSKGFDTAGLIRKVATAEVTAAMQQVALRVTGLEKRFDWKTLETAAFNAGSNYVVGSDHKSITSAVLANGASSFADQVNSNLIYTGQVGWANVSAVTFGTMAGTYSGTKLDQYLKTRAEESRQPEPIVDDTDYDVTHSSTGKSASQYLSNLSNRQSQNGYSPLTSSKNTGSPKLQKNASSAQRVGATQKMGQVSYYEGNGESDNSFIGEYILPGVAAVAMVATLPELVVIAGGFGVIGAASEMGALESITSPLLAKVAGRVGIASGALLAKLGLFSRKSEVFVENISKISPKKLIPTHPITMSKNKLKVFTKEIKDDGIKEPIAYVEEEGRLYVVSGHHRLYAARVLEFKEVPVEKVQLPYLGYKDKSDLFDYFGY